MADQPGGPVTGSRPVETTPIRVGRPQPGTAQLQPNRMYPATVLQGGNQPVLRLMGHNVNAEPRYPGLHAGQRLVVQPEVQGNRVMLHVLDHGDIQQRVSQQFGRLLHRFPWNLPGGRGAGMALPNTGQPGAGQAGGAGQGAGGQAARADAAGAQQILTGSQARSAGPGGLARGLMTAQPGAGDARDPFLSRPNLARLLLGGDSQPARLTRIGGEGGLPRPPLLAGLTGGGSGMGRAEAAMASRGGEALPPRTEAAGGEGRARIGAPQTLAPEGGRAASGRSLPAAQPASGEGSRPMSQLVSALAGAPAEPRSPTIQGQSDSIRNWIDSLLRAIQGGGEEAEQRGNLWDKLITEKGRLLMDRWAMIPLPLSGEDSGAWLQVQEREAGDGGDAASEQPHTLRIWLSSENLGGMELVLPMGPGRTWRIRCEAAATQQALAERVPLLERLCHQADHPVAVRVEGPEPEVAEPPASLKDAARLENLVSARF